MRGNESINKQIQMNILMHVKWIAMRKDQATNLLHKKENIAECKSVGKREQFGKRGSPRFWLK